MTISNPFSTDGSFSAAEKLVALEKDIASTRRYHEGLLTQKRMRPENSAAHLGALEAIAEDLRKAIEIEKQTRKELRQFDRVIGTVRVRTDLGHEIRPEVAAYNGQEMIFSVSWRIEGDHRRYPGEWALMPEQKCDIVWIASGDVADLRLA